MKKKILAAILTAAMTIGMVGCGSTSSSDAVSRLGAGNPLSDRIPLQIPKHLQTN